MAYPHGNNFVQTLIYRASGYGVAVGTAAYYRCNDATYRDSVDHVNDSAASPYHLTVHYGDAAQGGTLQAGGDPGAGSFSTTGSAAWLDFSGAVPAKFQNNTFSMLALVNYANWATGAGAIPGSGIFSAGQGAASFYVDTAGHLVLANVTAGKTIATSVNIAPTGQVAAVGVSFRKVNDIKAVVTFVIGKVTTGTYSYVTETFTLTPASPVWSGTAWNFTSPVELGALAGQIATNTGKLAEVLYLGNYAATAGEMGYYGKSLLDANPSASPKPNRTPAVQRVRRGERSRPIYFELRNTSDATPVTNAIVDGIMINLDKNGSTAAYSLYQNTAAAQAMPAWTAGYVTNLGGGQYALLPHPQNTDAIGVAMLTADYLGADTSVALVEVLGTDPDVPNGYASGVGPRTVGGDLKAIAPALATRPTVRRTFTDSIVNAFVPQVCGNLPQLAGFNANAGISTSWQPNGTPAGLAHFNATIGGRYHAGQGQLAANVSIGGTSFTVQNWNTGIGGCVAPGMKVTIGTGGTAETFFIDDSYAGPPGVDMNQASTIPLLSGSTFTRVHSAGETIVAVTPTGDDQFHPLPSPTYRFSGATCTDNGATTGAYFARLVMPGVETHGVKESTLYRNGQAFGPRPVSAIVLYRAGPTINNASHLKVYGVPAEQNYGTDGVVSGTINFYNATWTTKALRLDLPAPTYYDDQRSPSIVVTGAGNAPTANAAGTILDVIFVETGACCGDVIVHHGAGGLQMQDYDGTGLWGVETTAQAHADYHAALVSGGLMASAADVVIHACVGFNLTYATADLVEAGLLRIKQLAGAPHFVAHSTPFGYRAGAPLVESALPRGIRQFVADNPGTAYVDAYNVIKDPFYRDRQTHDGIHPTEGRQLDAAAFVDAIEYARVQVVVPQRSVTVVNRDINASQS